MRHLICLVGAALLMSGCSPQSISGTKGASKGFTSSLFVQQEHFVPAPPAALLVGSSDPMPSDGWVIGDPVDVPFGATEVLWTAEYRRDPMAVGWRMRVCPTLGDGHNIGAVSTMCSYVGGPEDGPRMSWLTYHVATAVPIGAASMVGISFAEVGDPSHAGSVNNVFYSFR